MLERLRITPKHSGAPASPSAEPDRPRVSPAEALRTKLAEVSPAFVAILDDKIDAVLRAKARYDRYVQDRHEMEALLAVSRNAFNLMTRADPEAIRELEARLEMARKSEINLLTSKADDDIAMILREAHIEATFVMRFVEGRIGS